MIRTLSLTALILALTGSVALADPPRHARDHRRSDSRSHVDEERTHRTPTHSRVHARDGSFQVDDHRVRHHRPVVRQHHYDQHQRPVVRQHHYDQHHRPAHIREYSETVPGYGWVAAHWQWNGVEWIWIDGHYEAAGRYR